MTRRVVAIDGPAASGKSSTAAAVARALGAIHVDSGALYRGLTVVALDQKRREPEAILLAAEARGLELRTVGGEVVPFLDGRPAEDHIRTPEVTHMVSEVSALPELRAWVNTRLRAVAEGGVLVVLDGRDIGTAVFPDAPVKVFLTASPEIRARRRLLQRGDHPGEDLVAREAGRLAERDRLDAARPVAPLRPAEDAILLDTSGLAFEEQVAAILREVRRALPDLSLRDSL